MVVDNLCIPPGPREGYPAAEDLLEWMERHFKAFGDTYKASIYGCMAYVTRDIHCAYHVLVENWQNYIKGQRIKRIGFLLGNGLMVSEGDLWKRQRRMIQPAFDHKSIDDLVDVITAVNLRLLEKWQRAARRLDVINVSRDVSGMALEVMLRFIFGDDYDEVAGHFNILSEETVRDLSFAQVFRKLGHLILQITAHRRSCASPEADALGLLMRARDAHTGRSMDDRQLMNEILTLVVAGHETTASTLSWMWFLIAQHPAVGEKLALELRRLEQPPKPEDLAAFPYSRQIIEEAMRLYPAGWLLTRRALGEDRLGPYFVPAGTEIYLPPYFIHRNPELWPNPDAFNPDRFAPDQSRERPRLASIPFSTGPRNCIGSVLARTQMQLHLLIIFRHLKLRHVQSKPIELDAGVNLRSRDAFIMRPESRGDDHSARSPSASDKCPSHA
jgi:cytochrome P450